MTRRMMLNMNRMREMRVTQLLDEPVEVDGKRVIPREALRAIDKLRHKATGTSERELRRAVAKRERLDEFDEFVANRHRKTMSQLPLEERRTAYRVLSSRGYLVHAFKHSRPSHHVGPCDEACRRGWTHHAHKLAVGRSR